MPGGLLLGPDAPEGHNHFSGRLCGLGAGHGVTGASKGVPVHLCVSTWWTRKGCTAVGGGPVPALPSST